MDEKESKEETGFEEVLSVLPSGWREKAKELGALKRARGVKTPEDLLKVVFLYLTAGKSFGNTAAMLKVTGTYTLNKTALYNRIGNSGGWLAWMCANMCRQGMDIGEKPAWLEGINMCLIDASKEPVFGNKEKQFILHYAVNLYDLSPKEMLLTGREEGEKLGHFQSFGPGDAAMCDRAYGTLQSIEYLRGRGCGFIIRLRTEAFNTYLRDENGAYVKTSAPDMFKDLKEGESGGRDAYYRYKSEQGEEYRPIRLCAYCKTALQEKESLEKLIESRSGKGGKKKNISAAVKANNRYVVLATSFEEPPAEEITGAYRLRWQIELVFKRLKSLFGYNEIPVKLDKEAKAWFSGKLLLAAITETWANKARLACLEQENAGKDSSGAAEAGKDFSPDGPPEGGGEKKARFCRSAALVSLARTPVCAGYDYPRAFNRASHSKSVA
jgi:hypothetical protein